jgi:hypothetical protein
LHFGVESAKYDSNGNPTGGIYTVSSNIAQNSDNNQHVFSTPLNSATFNTVTNQGYVENLSSLMSQLPSAAKTPINGTAPVFVSFEDQTSTKGKTAGSDYNYNDLDFVFTNVGVQSYPSAPEIDTNLAGLSLGLLSGVLLMMLERRRYS